MKLSEREFEVCGPGEQPLRGEALSEAMAGLTDWRRVEREGVEQLERCYRFDNFAEALAFTNTIGELAEAYDHHPSLLTEWGTVTVSWWTHTIGGLHTNDLILAAKCDRLYDPAGE